MERSPVEARSRRHTRELAGHPWQSRVEPFEQNPLGPVEVVDLLIRRCRLEVFPIERISDLGNGLAQRGALLGREQVFPDMPSARDRPKPSKPLGLFWINDVGLSLIPDGADAERVIAIANPSIGPLIDDRHLLEWHNATRALIADNVESLVE